MRTTKTIFTINWIIYLPSALGFPAGCHRYIRSTRSNGLVGPLKAYCASCMRATHTFGGNKLFTKEIYPVEDAVWLKSVTNLRHLLFSPSKISIHIFAKHYFLFWGWCFYSTYKANERHLMFTCCHGIQLIKIFITFLYAASSLDPRKAGNVENSQL